MIRYQETSSKNFAEEQPLLEPVTKQRLVKADRRISVKISNTVIVICSYDL
jgi:hypothetical protein